ncbi:MAG: flavodoxin-dependent (E)-4-hydroxy-3-methylbut-2-enyl-diphosphate synthase [Firmicutes bacterium]|nr:flavodoxin-dependent (E)-4-hydroxy-3-methylbut-2-enyl-diphosphate synthase [Bacillota bacterium]
MINRRKSKTVKIRNIEIGGANPLAIQSMTNVSSRDEKALLNQIQELEEAGCEIIRIAIPDIESAETLASVRKKTDMPLVADIHFDYRLAIEAIKSGADKIRINPGNIGSKDRVEAVVKEAKAAGIPIRVGVNSGSLEKDILEKNRGVTAEGLAESALRNLAIIEDMGYDNLVCSIKSSDVSMNYDAHIILGERTIHPIHIGITEAGTIRRGKVKSAIGIGGLILAGIGDTLRVSLTANPVEEVVFAKEILESLGLMEPKYNLVSCPTCGRTEVDLQSLAEEVDQRLMNINLRQGIKIAVMGCVVNGPGEAMEADYGIAGGKGKGVIIAKGEIVKTVPEEELVDQLIDIIQKEESK